LKQEHSSRTSKTHTGKFMTEKKATVLKDKPGGSIGDPVMGKTRTPTSLDELLTVLESNFGYDACHNKFFRGFLKDRLVADLGCGHGFSSFYFSVDAKKVVGFDIDVEAVDSAMRMQQKFESKQVEFHVFDGYDTGFAPGHFDVVVSSDVVEHVHEPDLYLKEASRICVPGGLLLLSTPNGQRTKGNQKLIHANSVYHVMEYTPLQLNQMMEKAGFKIEAFLRQSKEPLNPGFVKRVKAFTRPMRKRLGLVKKASKNPTGGFVAEDISSYTLVNCRMGDIEPDNCLAIVLVARKTGG